LANIPPQNCDLNRLQRLDGDDSDQPDFGIHSADCTAPLERDQTHSAYNLRAAVRWPHHGAMSDDDKGGSGLIDVPPPPAATASTEPPIPFGQDAVRSMPSEAPPMQVRMGGQAGVRATHLGLQTTTRVAAGTEMADAFVKVPKEAWNAASEHFAAGNLKAALRALGFVKAPAEKDASK
jgi:hypothetical protein